MEPSIQPLVIFKARISPPEFTELPPEMVEKWQAGLTASIPRMLRHRRKSVRTPADYQSKIVDKAILGFARILNPDFVSRSGLSKRDILERQKSHLKEQEGTYFKNIKGVFRRRGGVLAKEYLESLSAGARKYTQQYLKFVLPMQGHPKLGKGAATLVVMCLTGRAEVKNYLRRTDQIIIGQPVLITTPEEKSAFQRKLRGKLVFWGGILLRLLDECSPKYRNDVNEEVNKLIQGFARPDFAPFTAGGASHLDFSYQTVSDPTKPDKLKTQLCLEIQVSRA